MALASAYGRATSAEDHAQRDLSVTGLCVWDTRARQNGALSSNSWRGTGWEILTEAGSLATVFNAGQAVGQR